MSTYIVEYPCGSGVMDNLMKWLTESGYTYVHDPRYIGSDTYGIIVCNPVDGEQIQLEANALDKTLENLLDSPFQDNEYHKEYDRIINIFLGKIKPYPNVILTCDWKHMGITESDMNDLERVFGIKLSLKKCACGYRMTIAKGEKNT